MEPTPDTEQGVLISQVEETHLDHTESDQTPTRSNKWLLLSAAAVLLLTGSVGLYQWNREEPTEFNEHVSRRTQSKRPFYKATDGPLNVKLDLISPDALGGYQKCRDMRKALKEAAKLHANFIIQRNARQGNHFITPFPVVLNSVAVASRPVALRAEVSTASVSASSAAAPTPVTETDFETNNQEEGVDEADISKSDGTYVYTAYGDLLIVLDTDGNEVYRLRMPPIEPDEFDPLDEKEVTKDEPEDEPEVADKQPKDEVPIAVASPSEGVPIAIARPAVSASFIAPRRFVQRARIVAILLDIESERLSVVVSGYGHSIRRSLTIYPEHKGGVFSSFGNTHVRVYNTKSLTNKRTLTFMGFQNLNGNYRSARSIGKNAHIVTNTNMNNYQYLEGPLARFQAEFKDLDDDEYIAAAKKKAKGLVNTYAAQILKELQLRGNCKNTVKVVLLQQGLSTDNDMMNVTYSSGILNGYAEITSFDMSAKFRRKQIRAKKSGMFLPTSWFQVYASQTMMLLAGQGRHFQPDLSVYEEETYLVGFRLHGAKSSAAAIGSVPGYILNSFSLDHHEDTIRVATSSRAQFRSIRKTNSEGRTFFSREQVTETTNQLFVLSLPEKNGAIMKELGRVEGLGEKDEQIFAVRFLNKVAFVVTFRRTDPFYTIDLSDPTDPKVVGELKISGFSNYLHPINDDQSQVLAIGQEADPKTGRQIGLQVSLFDVSDLSNPSLLTKYVVNDDPSARSYSSSNAQWEHRAFRYLDESKILIIPVSLRTFGQNPENRENFDGFWTFNISPDKIERTYTISHVDAQRIYNYCWYPARLQARSFVFEGNLMTLKSHSVLSHSLTDGEKNWGLELDQGNNIQCSPYFF